MPWLKADQRLTIDMKAKWPIKVSAILPSCLSPTTWQKIAFLSLVGYPVGHPVSHLPVSPLVLSVTWLDKKIWLTVTLSVTLLVTYIVTDMAGMKAKWPTKVIKIPAWRHFHNFWLILPSCPAPTCQSVNIWRQSVNWLCLHEGIFITILPSSWSPTCLSVCQWKQNGRHEGIFINFFH